MTSSKPQKFVCLFEGCVKRFTRAEHLQRHQLNHRESDSTCARCRAHFARADLLARHTKRHEERDREAGGEGKGVLGTRKRCWRDENGIVMSSRPNKHPRDAAELAQTATTAAAITTPMLSAENRCMPSSPHSDSSSISEEASSPAQLLYALSTYSASPAGEIMDSWQVDFEEPYNPAYESANNSSWMFDELRHGYCDGGAMTEGWRSDYPQQQQQQQQQQQHRHQYPTASPSLPSPYSTPATHHHPKIDEISRANVIQLVVSATVHTNRPILATDPSLSLPALQSYLDLFSTRISHSYPLLQIPSSNPNSAPTLTLLSVLMLGATYGDKFAHQMASAVNDVMRGSRGSLCSSPSSTPGDSPFSVAHYSPPPEPHSGSSFRP